MESQLKHHHERLVTQCPLSEVWDASGRLMEQRQRLLDCEQLRQLLHRGAVRFVVANVGHPLRWVPETEAFAFWKTEVRSHLVNEPDRLFNVDHYPQGYCYIASEWQSKDEEHLVVVLECHH
jgi:hypothetical protein